MVIQRSQRGGSRPKMEGQTGEMAGEWVKESEEANCGGPLRWVEWPSMTLYRLVELLCQLNPIEIVGGLHSLVIVARR